MNSDLIVDELLKAYAIARCKLEMSMVQIKRKSMQPNSRKVRYFTSTPARNAFGIWICYAALVNKFYTVSEIASASTFSRQAIYKIYEECLAEGWLDVQENSDPVAFRGNGYTVKRWINYSEEALNRTETELIHSAFTAYTESKKVVNLLDTTE